MPRVIRKTYETQRVSFVIQTSRLKLLRAVAQKREINVSELIRTIITRALETYLAEDD